MRKIVCICLALAVLSAVSVGETADGQEAAGSCRLVLGELTAAETAAETAAQPAEDAAGSLTMTVPLGVTEVPGGVCGLMAEVTVSDGWLLIGAALGEAAAGAGMTLTVLPDGAGAVLLLDSPEPVPAEAVVVWLELSVESAGRPTEVVTVTVAAARAGQGSVPIYYMKETGVIRTLPLAGCTRSWAIPAAETAETAPEIVTDADTGEVREPGTETRAAAETDAETGRGREVPEPPAEADPGDGGKMTVGWVLIGCREAVTGTGAGRELHVRFLFRAADGSEGMPDVRVSACENGGVIRVTFDREPDGLLSVTFSGLPVTGTLIFSGSAQNGESRIAFTAQYKNAVFRGWSCFDGPIRLS